MVKLGDSLEQENFLGGALHTSLSSPQSDRRVAVHHEEWSQEGRRGGQEGRAEEDHRHHRQGQEAEAAEFPIQILIFYR